MLAVVVVAFITLVAHTLQVLVALAGVEMLERIAHLLQ